MTGGVHGGDRDSGLARPDRRPDTSPTTGECTAHIAATSAVPGSGSGTSVRHLRGARRWRGACAWQGRSGVRGCLGGCTGATVTRARPSQDPHPDTSPVHAPSHRQSALRLRTYSSESSHRGLSIVMHQPTKPCGGRRGAYHGGRHCDTVSGASSVRHRVWWHCTNIARPTQQHQAVPLTFRVVRR